MSGFLKYLHKNNESNPRPIKFENSYRATYRAQNDIILAANKFPWKLWKIINSCRSGAIKWSQDGKNIVIHKRKFQREFLDPQRKTFKTNNIGSFIRQLNLYGFKKVQPACKQFVYDSDTDLDVQEFHNDLFCRGRPDLVHDLRRHVGIRRAKEQAAKSQLSYSCSSPESKSSTPCFMFGNCYNSSSMLHCNGLEVSFGNLEKMVAFPIYMDGNHIPHAHPRIPPVLVEWSRSNSKYIATQTMPGTSILVHSNSPQETRIVIDSETDAPPIETDYTGLLNDVTEAVSAGKMSESFFEKSPCTASRQLWTPPRVIDDESYDKSPLAKPFSTTQTQNYRPGQSLLRRTSSPISPTPGEEAPKYFDQMQLSPIIVPCEQALVQAAMISTFCDLEEFEL